MKRLLILFLAGLAFVFNLVNFSGLGAVYNTEHYTRLLLIVLTVVLLFRYKIPVYRVTRGPFLWCMLMVAVFLFSAVLRGSLEDAFNCLTSFLIVYVFSQYALDGYTFKWLGRMLLFGSFSLLFIYLKLDVLSGWNENGIAMLCFFAYVCYAASTMFAARGMERKFAIVATILFIWMLSETNARSSMFASTVTLAVLLFPRSLGSFFSSKQTRRILFHAALILAVSLAALSTTSLYADLDLWSYNTFGKPLLNGRETAWRDGLKNLSSMLLFGRGNFKVNNWHNWAMSLLTAHGVLGYISWTGFVQKLLAKGNPYIHDPYVLGLITAFLLSLLQQSAELGLIGSASIHLLPYMLLGLLLGRVRMLSSMGSEE